MIHNTTRLAARTSGRSSTPRCARCRCRYTVVTSIASWVTNTPSARDEQHERIANRATQLDSRSILLGGPAGTAAPGHETMAASAARGVASGVPPLSHRHHRESLAGPHRFKSGRFASQTLRCPLLRYTAAPPRNRIACPFPAIGYCPRAAQNDASAGSRTEHRTGDLSLGHVEFSEALLAHGGVGAALPDVTAIDLGR